ncbi:hypothetical protein [Piscinibacter gummiphilus]|uniref:Uncharacterized protein n=1 Tax=Piscinibacter gummiphilus TaxID=946333 RepID=A0A1W6L3X7_9BURK|nr:hypothetical protein [Piscinibacter gummiphilus]ARN19011.1 hypothetical protein A4W93_03240 [Piscinibacter gummiphilus]ATU63656.1 hypothetical protein CPZ87_03315 [Piscinibacter gummiphilus]GLS93417.1 hypothetical protein GCM10007918_07080 [Piscinibacter gummiphilus]
MPDRRLIAGAAAGLLAASSAWAQTCPAGEDVLWSCETRSKTYALCASKDAARDRGHVQYRVRQGERTEFVFPEQPRPPAGLFLYQLFNKSAQVSFANGAYSYELREAMEAAGEIEVTREGRRVALVKCRTSSDTLTLTPTIRRFEAMGMTR